VKKLILGTLITALVALVILPVYALAEMLSNAAFESWVINGASGPPDNWVLSSSSSFSATREATTVYGGTYSVNLTWTTTENRDLQQLDIPVMADSTYTFSVWLYDNDPAGEVRIYIRWEDSGGDYISNSGFSDYSTDSDSWQLLTTESQAAPGTAAQCDVRIRCYDVSDNWGGSATVYVDDASLTGSESVIPTPHTIYEIQYTFDPSGDSPYKDSVVVTSGIVTAASGIFPDGYFIQDGVGAWNGIYVYDATNTVSQGDSITVIGTVDEFYDRTEISSVTSMVIRSSGHQLPDPFVASTGTVDISEAYEGVLVKVQDVVVTDDSLGYGEWEVNDGSGPCRVDDWASYSYTPTLGDSLNVTGIVDYAYSNYKIEPRYNPDIIPPNPTLKIYHIDVGQGDATLIISPAGKTLLMDGGPYNSGDNVIVPQMLNLGVGSLDYMVASHYDADHVGGLDEVVDGGFLPGIAYDRGDSVSGNQFNQYLDAIRSVRQTINVGDLIDLGGGVTATCYTVSAEVLGLGPVDTTGTDQVENSLSIGLLVEYSDFEYWISGDLTGGGFSTADVEYLTASAMRDVDVLRISHHGSNTSTNTSFLRRLIPEVTIISLGTNPYGHPHQEVLDRLNALPMMEAIYQTESGSGGTAEKVQVANGTVLVETDGTQYTVSGGDLSPSSYSVDEVAYTPRVIINEIMKDPYGDDSQREWFELLNGTDQVVDINGWVIRDEDYDYHTINNGGPLEIEPYGYLALARSGDPGGFTPDYVYSGDLSLGNGSDEIILMDGSQVMDWVFYDDEITWTDSTGHSMQLCNQYGDNNYWENWAVETDSSYGPGGYGTPGSQNTCHQVSVEDGSAPPLPIRSRLFQNYPNPFNATTLIKYDLPVSCQVRLDIFNILGQKVATLVNGNQKAGHKTARWDAGSFTSGIYFYRLQAGDFMQTRKMILLR